MRFAVSVSKALRHDKRFRLTAHGASSESTTQYSRTHQTISDLSSVTILSMWRQITGIGIHDLCHRRLMICGSMDRLSGACFPNQQYQKRQVFEPDNHMVVKLDARALKPRKFNLLDMISQPETEVVNDDKA